MMLYEFVDTNAVGGTSLPSEAMNFNGNFLEDLIPGYRTLSVSGREVLSTEINAMKINQVPGMYIFGTTLPERIITVRYQLLAKTPKDFMLKFRELMAVLNNRSPLGYPIENTTFSFNDEPEVMYFGMLGDIENPPAGQLYVVSTYQLYCGDPFKRAAASAYDPAKPLKYDEANPYGSKSYPNTQSFKWIYSRHYSGLENYSSLNTDIKITINGTVKGGSVKHLGSGVSIAVPNITNGTAVIDTEMFNLQLNGKDTIIDGDFFKLAPGDNGFLFEAETANATVSFEWYHRFS